MRIIIEVFKENNVKRSEVVSMNSALDIACFLIDLSQERGITNLKLQKMLYFIQREAIRNLNREAFWNRIEAWQYGPVIPDIYYEFASYGSSPIMNLDIDRNEIEDFEIRNIIQEVFNQNIDRSVWDMVDETHTPGNAWDSAFKRGYREAITINDILNEVGRSV